jgi:hypothetical protein
MTLSRCLHSPNPSRAELATDVLGGVLLQPLLSSTPAAENAAAAAVLALLPAHRWDQDASNTGHGGTAVDQLCLHIPPAGLWVLCQVLQHTYKHICRKCLGGELEPGRGTVWRYDQLLQLQGRRCHPH